MSTTTVLPAEECAALLAHVQDLQEQVESAGELVATDVAQELVSALVEMYGLALARIATSLSGAGEHGEGILAGLAEDPLIATLLLVHDLHPIPLEQRVAEALASVRPYMESHGGDVELLSLQDGVARISLRGSCSDCAASSATLELAIKQALEDAAPDLDGLEVEGMAAQISGVALPMAGEGAPSTGGLPIVVSTPAPPPAWFEVRGAAGLRDGDMLAAPVGGSELLIANVEGALLAYHDECAACGGTLHDGELVGGALACRHCGRSFFLPRAGRSMDEERVQLQPVPLLRELGSVKVALAS
jgi:Fe-S cluster biogenesis protein NfuA/nitrite reductase/ring-hydroxylating ferredoxin subunit